MMVVAKGTWISISFKIKAEVGKSCISHQAPIAIDFLTFVHRVMQGHN